MCLSFSKCSLGWDDITHRSIGQCFISSGESLRLLPSSSPFMRLLIQIEESNPHANLIIAKQPQHTTPNSPKPSNRSSPRSSPAVNGSVQIGLRIMIPLIMNQGQNLLNVRTRKQSDCWIMLVELVLCHVHVFPLSPFEKLED